MDKEVDNFKRLRVELDEALSLLNDSDKVTKSVGSLETSTLVDAQSLLSRCENALEKRQSNKKVIRSIHHFACSGGTVLSKCISAMPNTFLISEVHPTTTLTINPSIIEFRPTDITSLGRYANLPRMDELAEKMFLSQIDVANEHLNAMSSKLVLREHTHSDYCLGDEDAIANEPVLVKLFKQRYSHRKLATVRNPIDSFVSLQANGWLHFSPPSFDQYCERLLAFISHFEDCEIVKYEDFVAEPKIVMQRITGILDIEYSPYFEDIFSIFKVTGDSGRSSDVISERPRRAINGELKKEIYASKHYTRVCELLNYKR
ncbi:hypothetical protein KUL17_29260 [Alteromonas sp. KUL17]|uniref:hypothetical protein n=1 Tax=Alteromonas sp. KUL17 TaxID=2480796 RepID=UPI0010374373|nr:hypothetical protein [Alteromonas sp. KUL17]TAP24558.1 hypothetical protein KUL49_14550 [Alteromonas sp. KUL17]GEA04029.1 hypothetical protein KUL17_29260 [Alteromonas sp. KUL17]